MEVPSCTATTQQKGWGGGEGTQTDSTQRDRLVDGPFAVGVAEKNGRKQLCGTEAKRTTTHMKDPKGKKKERQAASPAPCKEPNPIG